MRHRRSPSGGPIQVALLAPSFHTGGAERQMLFLAGALPRDEFQVRLLAMAERGKLAAEAEAMGIPVHVLGIDRGSFLRSPLRGASSIRRAVAHYRDLTRDVDVVDAWLVPAYTFAGTVQPMVRVPVLLAGRRSALDIHRTRRWYRELAGRFAMRSIQGVVANSAAAAAEAVDIEHIPAERVHVIRNAVDGVPLPEEERQALRASWGLAPGEVLVGCVGNYKPGKGQQLLVDVADRMRHDHPDVRFRFVGEGDLRSWLETEIARRRLGDVIALHGGEPDARRLYAAFDIAVQASDSEGLPNAVLEAAAAGVAIVATDVGGTREIVTHEVDGLLVPRGDVDGLASALGRLAGDPTLRRTLGAAAAARARDFSPERLAVQTGALYRRLLDEAP
jgi:glycosyltransferase involved in cell wall biosynthesis